MIIALVSSPHVPVPPVKYGGTERVVYALIKGLSELGHKVILLAPGDSDVAGLNCELIPITPEHIFFGKNQKDQQKVVEEVNKINVKTQEILKEILPQVDLIHSHGFDLIDFQDFPNLTTLHGMFLLEKMDYFEKRKGLNFVSISQNQQNSFPDLQYIGVIYNGLIPDDFPFNPTPENYVCFLGRFDREKNPHEAIQLAIQLGIPIKLAGKIDFLGEEYFKNEVEPYFSHPLVTYLGELEFTQKAELLKNATCNLHPANFREPFGLTVMEAAYCGTPTLAIRRGSMAELIEDERTGFLVEDFAEGYHRMDKIRELDRRYIAQRARLLFNYKTMSRQYEHAYQEVIALNHESTQPVNRSSQYMSKLRREIANIWDEKLLHDDLNTFKDSSA